MSFVCSCVFVIASTFGVLTADAQTRDTTTCPPVSGPPYAQCQVDTPATLKADSPLPSIPEMLKFRDQGLIGKVRLQFVVDTLGRIAPSSARFIEPQDEIAAQAVRNALPRLRFHPAIRQRAKVSVLLEEWFVLVASTTGAPPLPGFRRDTTSDGIARTIVGHSMRDSIGASHLSIEDLIGAQRAAVVYTSNGVGVAGETGRRTVCVTFTIGSMKVAPDLESLAAMSSDRISAVSSGTCPRTFASMTYTPGQPVAPPGHVDPYRIHFNRVEGWSADEVHFEVERQHGMGGTLLTCGSRRVDGQWIASCGTVKMWTH